MTWLLDTCVLSDFARGETQTLVRLKALSPTALAVSAITVMEVEYGLALAHGMTLVTSNVREFGRVSGLQVENWRGR